MISRSFFGEALQPSWALRVAVSTLCPGPVATEFFEANGPSPVERIVPRAAWQEAAAVARAALDGLEQNRRVIVPGAAMRAMTAGRSLAPRAIALRAFDRLLATR